MEKNKMEKNKMEKNKNRLYHLTFLRNGKYNTVFCEISSIENFMVVEKELGREVHILYSRELSVEEWTKINESKLRTNLG